ncbi:unnamed protein product [Cylicocyclus nassatus]|uniref:Cation efflux protein transmembrane domain-containing protein n=1 Tax=Cylicocyclus nassatus TaxID=53992 RepID=A0AA36HDI7_CYLNA|nr:unnamed protein product [Cylicocyclus nassatus]
MARHRTGTRCCNAYHSSKKMVLDKGVQTMIIMSIVNASNLLLVIVKGIVAYHTGSFSIANSTLETFGDVFVGFLLLLQRLQARIVNRDKFPRGRATEALANVVASVVMIVLAGVNAVLNIDRFFANKFDPHLELEDIFVVAFNILLKMALFAICYTRKDEEQVNVLLKDQGVDVITNSTAVLFAVFTRYYHKNWDIVGATIIFLIICRNWLPILFSNCNRVHGIAPTTSKMDAISNVVNGLQGIEKVRKLVAYHRGQAVIVELYAQVNESLLATLEAERLNAAQALEEIEFVGTAYVFYDIGEIATTNVSKTDPALPGSPDESEISEVKDEDTLLRTV